MHELKADEVIVMPQETTERAGALRELLVRIDKHRLQPPVQCQILDHFGEQLGSQFEMGDIRTEISELEDADEDSSGSVPTVIFLLLEDSRGAKVTIKIEREGHGVN